MYCKHEYKCNYREVAREAKNREILREFHSTVSWKDWSVLQSLEGPIPFQKYSKAIKHYNNNGAYETTPCPLWTHTAHIAYDESDHINMSVQTLS